MNHRKPNREGRKVYRRRPTGDREDLFYRRPEFARFEGQLCPRISLDRSQVRGRGVIRSLCRLRLYERQE